MTPDEARNLKAEIFEKVLGYVAVGTAPDGFPVFAHPRAIDAAKAGGTFTAPEMDIAIGLTASNRHTPNSNKPDIQIAVLCADRTLMNKNKFLAEIGLMAKGEIDTTYSGSFMAHAFPLDRERPVKAGCSTGHYRGGSGSVGPYVKTPQVPLGVLSASHVYGRVNKATHGDVLLQPSKPDQGTDPTDRLGNLAHYIPLKLGQADINFVDCAIAGLVNNGAPDLSLPTGSPIPKLSGKVVEAEDDMKVWKVGAASILTAGSVFTSEIDQVYVKMSDGRTLRRVRFDRQVIIAGQIGGGAFSKRGDSGALVYQAEGSAVAVVVGGSQTGAANGRGLCVASPIQAVLDALEAELVV